MLIYYERRKGMYRRAAQFLGPFYFIFLPCYSLRSSPLSSSSLTLESWQGYVGG